MSRSVSQVISSSLVDTLHIDTGPVNLVVIHDMECPMVAGRAVSWAEYLARNPYPFFAQLYADPANLVQVAPLDTKCAHCGNGNAYLGHRSIGIEHAGYASFTRAAWLSPDGLAEMHLSARAAAEIAVRWNLPIVWLSPTDLLNSKRGFTSHHNCSIALHGSTHTDPDPNFPVDVWLDLVRQYATGPVIPPTMPVTDQEDDVSNPNSHKSADGRVELFYISPIGDLYHAFQAPTAGAALGPLMPFGQPDGVKLDPTLGIRIEQNADGRLEIYTGKLDSAGGVLQSNQVEPSGAWTPLVQLP